MKFGLEVERDGDCLEFKLTVPLSALPLLGTGLVITYEQAARILDCTKRTVQRAVEDGQLEAINTGRRHPNGRPVRHVVLADVVALLDEDL